MTEAKNKAQSQEEAATTQTEDELQDYMSFAEAAKQLDVRFQQVYQRAVVRSKMRWVEGKKRKMVHKDDVKQWGISRKEYFAAKQSA